MTMLPKWLDVLIDRPFTTERSLLIDFWHLTTERSISPMSYHVGQRLLLKTPLHYQKPAWYTVKTQPNKEGIQLLETDSGCVAGLRPAEIEKYLQEAEKCKI